VKSVERSPKFRGRLIHKLSRSIRG
jgi:hypothetical protein